MATEISADTPEPSAASDASSSFWRSVQRAQSAIHSLSAVLGPLPDPHLAFSDDPAAALLRDPAVSAAVSRRLRLPSSGAGDDHLCRWLYDTFHSTVPALRLAVLSFLPALAGAYLSRSSSSPSHSPSGHRHPLAGFEAVLLALYAHETVHRGGEPETVTLPSLAAPSVYHEVRPPSKKAAAEADELNSSSSASRTAVVSPALEPHGTVRSTRRARIIGVALELYYSNISQMPNFSKIEFCEFCIAWSGQGAIFKAQKQGSSSPASASQRSDFEGEVEEGKRIPLPWELFQPMLRIVGHCLLGPGDSAELRMAAYKAAQCLHARAAWEIDSPAAVLASRSLIRLGKIAAAETEAAAEEAATEAKTAAPDAKEPATEAATEAKIAAMEEKEPATEGKESALEVKELAEEAKETATEAKESAAGEAKEMAAEAKTAAIEAKEPATEAKESVSEVKESAAEAKEIAVEAKESAAAEAKKTAAEATEAKEPATEAKESVSEVKEEAKESVSEVKELAAEAKETAVEAKETAAKAMEAKEPATEAKESVSEVKESAAEAKETAVEAKESAAAEAKETAAESREAKEPATEAKESVSEVKELAAEAKETAVEAKESAEAEAKETAAEAMEAKEPATEAKESVSEVKELAAEAKETVVEAKESAAAKAKETAAEAKESDAAPAKKPAAEANRGKFSELESIEADAQSA